MARGTDFGGVHSHRDLNLIQQKVDEQPAEPKLNLINIPGADGSKDMSELPGGRLTYKDRKVTWIFALYPGENWDIKHRQVSNALNGKRCRITLDSNPGYYYDGRVVVKKYSKDQQLRQITVEAICLPWAWKQQETVVTATLAANHATAYLTLHNEKKSVVPTIAVTTDTVLVFGGAEYVISAGSHKILDICLQEGGNLLQVRTASGVTTDGKVSITYQEGAL